MASARDKRLHAAPASHVNQPLECSNVRNAQIQANGCSRCEKFDFNETWREELKWKKQPSKVKILRHLRSQASAHRSSPCKRLDSHAPWLEELKNFKKKKQSRKTVVTDSHSNIPIQLDASKAIDKCNCAAPNHKPLSVHRKAVVPLHRESGGLIYEPNQLVVKRRCNETLAVYPAKRCSDINCKIIVNKFHAHSFLDAREHAEKTRILAQNGLTKAEATAFNYLPQDNTSKLAKKNFDDSCVHTGDRCAVREEEQYVGQPFYIDGDSGTQQSRDVRCSPSEMKSDGTDEEDEADEREMYFAPKCVLSPSLFPNVAPYLNFASHSKKGPTMPEELRNVLRWKANKVTPRTVGRVVLNTGFRIVKSATDWMAVWEERMRSTGFQTLYSHQKFNHMPGTAHIGRKDKIWRSIHENIKNFGAKEFGFMQQTYILPTDLEELRRVWPTESKWIVKPPGGSRGIGIRVVSKWTQFRKDRPMVVQKYIERPLLIIGTKFDLRLYAVVTSIDPLKIYLYKDGLARFASKKYSTASNRIHERCMHLTNYSLNKYSRNYSKNENFKNHQGHKWTLQALWSFLEKSGVNTKCLWATLRDLVIRAIICGEAGLYDEYSQHVNFRYNCYDMFGLDVLLDEKMVPWLLEINIMPSLNSDLKLDCHVKGPLVQALMNTALYQVPPSLDDQQQADIIRELELDCAYLCMDRRLFATCLTAEEAAKHNMYTNHPIDSRAQYLDAILEHLSSDDVRCLILAEDELHRCTPLERIFPTTMSYKYLDFMEPRYYNRLLDAWESRYGHRRGEGIQQLQQLCKEGYHLQVSDAIINQEPTRMLTTADLMPKRRLTPAVSSKIKENSTNLAEKGEAS